MSTGKDNQTIIALIAVLSILYLIWRLPAFLVLAVLIGIASLASPVFKKAIIRSWLRCATTLGFINSRIILTLLYFLLLTPLALISRLFSKDKLQLRKKQKPDDSYYHQREHRYTPDDFENPW